MCGHLGKRPRMPSHTRPEILEVDKTHTAEQHGSPQRGSRGSAGVLNSHNQGPAVACDLLLASQAPAPFTARRHAPERKEK